MRRERNNRAMSIAVTDILNFSMFTVEIPKRLILNIGLTFLIKLSDLHDIFLHYTEQLINSRPLNSCFFLFSPITTMNNNSLSINLAILWKMLTGARDVLTPMEIWVKMRAGFLSYKEILSTSKTIQISRVQQKDILNV